MGEFKKEYDEIEAKRRKILKELKRLENTEVVKQLRLLEKENKKLLNERYEIERHARLEEYKECVHMLVVSKIVYGRKNIPHKNYGCMKCGLDDSLIYEYDLIPAYTRDMNEFIRGNRLEWERAIQEKNTDIVCDLDLAKAIYSKIKEAYPDIDDETALQYFKVALEDIRNIDVTQERKEERAKRLELLPSFKRWSEESVEEIF